MNMFIDHYYFYITKLSTNCTAIEQNHFSTCLDCGTCFDDLKDKTATAAVTGNKIVTLWLLSHSVYFDKWRRWINMQLVTYLANSSSLELPWLAPWHTTRWSKPFCYGKNLWPKRLHIEAVVHNPSVIIIKCKM